MCARILADAPILWYSDPPTLSPSLFPSPAMLRSDLHTSAVRHLRRRDRVLRGVIDRVGPFTLKPQRDRFRSLVRAIIAQQISGSAARSIMGRFEALSGTISPGNVLKLSPARMRTAGVSPQKAAYLLDLAEKIHSGAVRLSTAGRLSDDEIVAELTQVKGIGVWTAQMFLMFSLGRPDVLPHADLGIRAAMRNLYELPELPDRDTCHRIAEPWRPYATVACWYCWRSLELRTANE